MLCLLCGCSSDEPSNHDDLVGSWCGIRYYYNPASGTKYQYLRLTLEADGTGSLEYEAPSSYSVGNFTWSVDNGYVICRGIYAGSEYVDENYSLRLRIDGDRLYPEGHFDVFILTKDGSVMTDGNGNEIGSADDLADLLMNTWVTTDGLVVTTFYYDGSYEEYVLSSKKSSTYTSVTEGYYEYTPLTKQLLINSSIWEVQELTVQTLKIKNGNKTISYNMGSKSDIPTSADITSFLSSAKMGWSDKNNKYCFLFTSDGSVYYIENSGKKYGSYGIISLSAKGGYSLNGDKLTCYFNDVFWEYGSAGTKDYFPDWTNGQSCIKTYTISVVYDSLLVTFPNGTKVYLDAL